MALSTGLLTEENPISGLFYSKIGFTGLIITKLVGTVILLSLDWSLMGSYKQAVANGTQNWNLIFYRAASTTPVIMMILVGVFAVFGNLWAYFQIAAIHGIDPFRILPFLAKLFSIII